MYQTTKAHLALSTFHIFIHRYAITFFNIWFGSSCFKTRPRTHLILWTSLGEELRLWLWSQPPPTWTVCHRLVSELLVWPSFAYHFQKPSPQPQLLLTILHWDSHWLLLRLFDHQAMVSAVAVAAAALPLPLFQRNMFSNHGCFAKDVVMNLHLLRRHDYWNCFQNWRWIIDRSYH